MMGTAQPEAAMRATAGGLARTEMAGAPGPEQVAAAGGQGSYRCTVA